MADLDVRPRWRGRRALTDVQARLLRESYATGRTSAARLAAIYGLSAATILQIVRGDTYPRAGGPIHVPRRRV